MSKYAYHTFVLWKCHFHLLGTNTTFVAGIFAIWVNALLMSIPSRVVPRYPAVCTSPGLSGVYELLDVLRIHPPALGTHLTVADGRQQHG